MHLPQRRVAYGFSFGPTRVAALSPRASLGRRTVCGRMEQRRPPVSKRYETKVRMEWGSFLLAIAALETPTRNGYNAQGVNLMFPSLSATRPISLRWDLDTTPVESRKRLRGVSGEPRVNSSLVSTTYCYPKGGGSPARKLPRW